MENDKKILNDYSQCINEVTKIINLSLVNKDKNIVKIIKDMAATEGKMIRAIFVIMGAGFGTIEKKRLYEIAAGIECLHLATLIHDDVIDESKLRRGKETLQSKYGVKSALFTGDYMFATAYILFSKSAGLKEIEKVSRTIQFVCEGEINQFFSLYSLDTSIKAYLKRVYGKCASLFSLSLSIGAVEAGADIKISNTLSKIGYNIGMAFQIIDDILDLTSNETVLGKPSGEDIRQGIYNFQVIYEIKKGNGRLIQLLKEEKKDYNQIIEIVTSSMGMNKSKLMAKKYTERALRLINQLPKCEQKQRLQEIAEKMLVRNY